MAWLDDTSRWNVMLSIICVIALILIGIFAGDDVYNAGATMRLWFLHNISWSWLVYCSCAAALLLMFFPFAPICVLSGFTFGVGFGLLIQCFASMLAAMVLFVVGRYILRDKIHDMLSKHPAYVQVQRTTANTATAARLSFGFCFLPIVFAGRVHEGVGEG